MNRLVVVRLLSMVLALVNGWGAILAVREAQWLGAALFGVVALLFTWNTVRPRRTIASPQPPARDTTPDSDLPR